MSALSPGRGRLFILVAVLTAVIIAGGVTGFLVLRSLSHAGEVEKYHNRLAADWEKIGQQADIVDAALTRVASPDDLVDVSNSAANMRTEITRVVEDREKTAPPSGEQGLGESEISSLRSLDGYLEMVEELASGKDATAIEEKRGLLESRSARAFSDINEFLAKASFMYTSISSNLFQAGIALEDTFKPPHISQDMDAVYNVVNTFMTADITQFDPEVIWGLAASKTRIAMEMLGTTPEKFAAGWRDSWGTRKPVDFYVSRRNITFSDPSNATVRVIVYLESGSTLIEEVSVTREPDGWKIERYPFVGWG